MGLIKHNLLHMCFFHVTDYNNFLSLANNDAILQTAFDLEVNSYLDEEWWPDDSASAIFKMLPNLPKKQGTKYYINVLNQLNSKSREELIALFGQDMFRGGNVMWGTETNSIKELLNRNPTEHNTWGSTGQNIQLVRTQLEYRVKSSADAVRNRIPQELKSIVDGLLTFKKPIFNWKKFFRNFMANAFDSLPKSTRRKESTRFTGALGHKLAKKHTILVGVDTSGSISQKDLDEFFSEIYHVWKAGANVDIAEFDTRIQSQYKYKGKTPASVSGRGGTDFHPFVDYFNSNRHKYSLGICFTDGYADLNNLNPTGKFCWVITSDGAQNSKYPGYKICIPKIVE
jgi:predicted metal-dependent peptidase